MKNRTEKVICVVAHSQPVCRTTRTLAVFGYDRSRTAKTLRYRT